MALADAPATMAGPQPAEAAQRGFGSVTGRRPVWRPALMVRTVFRPLLNPQPNVLAGPDTFFDDSLLAPRGHYIWGLAPRQGASASVPAAGFPQWGRCAVSSTCGAHAVHMQSTGPPQRRRRAHQPRPAHAPRRALAHPQATCGTRAGRRRRRPRESRAHSKPGPGSPLRPGATCSWPVTSANG